MLICAAWSLLYISLGVVPLNFCRTIQLKQYCLMSLLANPLFLWYSKLLCRLRTDKFLQSVVILNHVNSSKEFRVCIKLYILDMSLDFGRRLQELCIDLIDSQWLKTLLENYDSHRELMLTVKLTKALSETLQYVKIGKALKKTKKKKGSVNNLLKQMCLQL